MSKITIGMAHHNDFNGVYFSIQDIIKELRFNNRGDLLDRIEFLVVENDPESEHAKSVANFKCSTGLGDKFKIVNLPEIHGTSVARNKIIDEANTEFVLVMDCHVFLCPVVETLDKLIKFTERFPKPKNLYQGPLVYDNMENIATHFNDEWGGQMWGRWGNAWSCRCDHNNLSILNKDDKCKFVGLVDQKEKKECDYCSTIYSENIPYYGHEAALKRAGMNPLGFEDVKSFEIFSQGLGLFFTAKEHWLRFNDHCRGFGGEECYIHEKYRKNGRKAICLPFLKWLHRFQRPDGVKYELTIRNKVRNYVLEFTELGLDLSPIQQEFVQKSNFDKDLFSEYVEEAEKIYGK